ncbi:FlgK family flagellar hook-associated protein [Enterobacter hormaechei]
MSELNKIVGVDVTVQDSGTCDISIANGCSLVQGSDASQLAAVKSECGPSAYNDCVCGCRSRRRGVQKERITTGRLEGC